MRPQQYVNKRVDRGTEMKTKPRSFKAIINLSVVARISKQVALTILAALTVLSAAQDFRSQASGPSQIGATDWKAVELALGKAGSVQPGDVYKVSFPRGDLKVTVGGVELKPALALGTWVAFKKAGDMTVVMGDLVLTENEVTPVLTRLQQGAVETTALHNH